MRYIMRHLLVTPRNLTRIQARILPPDQREAVRPGILLTHYTFRAPQGRRGFIIISHAARRAGICFEGPSEWGHWSAEEHLIRTDSGRIYTSAGELVSEISWRKREDQEIPQESNRTAIVSSKILENP